MEVSKEKEIRDILIKHLRNAGIHVVTDIHEGQSVLNDSGFAVRMQSRLGQLKDIVDFIRTNLKRKRGGQMDIQVTEWVKKKSELEIGHRIKSHKIDIGGLNHGLNRHGINGSGINNKSIPLQKEDLELAPYILLCPDKITLGSRNNNLDSLVYEKRLSNGVIAYVEAEASLDGSVMVSKTMWADIDPHKMSPSLLVDARSEERPQAHVQNVIQSNDRAKIIKEAEDAIRKEEILARADKLFVFSDKTVYGFVKNDTIYIDTREINVETPIHEYSHLWAEALRQQNPDEWKNIVSIMKSETELWNKVKENYPHLKTDDEVADEVLATYSGRHGIDRLRDECRNHKNGNTILRHIGVALDLFWKNVSNFFGVSYKSADEVADRVFYDLLNEVNPLVYTKQGVLKLSDRMILGQKISQQITENPFSDHIRLGKATPDYDSADAAGLGVQFPILLNGTIIGWLPVDALYDKDKPNHLISDDSRYLRMSSVGDSAEIKKEYRGQGYGKAAYYELAVKAARMGMTLCSAPVSSRSENANNLWESLVSSGYARQNGDRYEFINSRLFVSNQAVGGGIQAAIKDMEKPSDRMVLRQRIADRLRELLPNIGDEFFVNDGFDVTFNGLNHGFGDERGLAEKVYHSNLKDRFGDRFICGTTNGGIEIGEMTTGDLQQLNYILDEKKYSFSKEAAHENALKPDSRFSEEMQEANANLRNVLDEARKDLGKTYKISPLDINMGNWTAHVDTIEYNPEFDLDYYVASGIDKDGGHSNIQIHKLDNISSICELTKAVHEAHVRHLEQAAKQAIHNRIVMPSARSFTSDQVEVLNRFHRVAAPNTPVGEVFRELLQEVAQEPDVARKPEKWVSDTAKELDDLADGITRELSRGQHI